MVPSSGFSNRTFALEWLASLQPRDGLDTDRSEAHDCPSLLHKTQQVKTANIAFGNSSRSDASCIGNLDQSQCFLRAQLDE